MCNALCHQVFDEIHSTTPINSIFLSELRDLNSVHIQIGCLSFLYQQRTILYTQFLEQQSEFCKIFYLYYCGQAVLSNTKTQKLFYSLKCIFLFEINLLPTEYTYFDIFLSFRNIFHTQFPVQPSRRLAYSLICLLLTKNYAHKEAISIKEKSHRTKLGKFVACARISVLFYELTPVNDTKAYIIFLFTVWPDGRNPQ